MTNLSPTGASLRIGWLIMLAAFLGLMGPDWQAEGASTIASLGSQEDALGVPAGRQANRVAVIPLHGPIDQMTVTSLRRRLAEANQAGFDAVVLELDTPGGDLNATFEILEIVRTEAPPNTVAWIRPKAFSAGTIIALAAREIITSPTGVFGDAAPIQALPGLGLQQLPAAERAKIEAPLLSELVFDARRQGWDEKLVQAFVAVDIELWLLRHRTTGDILFVDAEEYERIFNAPPKRTGVTRLPAPAPRDPETGLLPEALAAPVDAGPKFETRDEAIEFVQERRSQRPDLGPDDASNWEPLGQVVTSDELLVLRSDEAMAYGLSSSTVDDEPALANFFGAAETTRFSETWSEGLVRFLTLWPVRAVLIAVMLVGFFIEIAAPGYGVFGIAALTSLAILVGAPWLAGLSDWWPAIVVILGLGLVVAELFFLPGFGLAGLAGGGLIFIGLVGTFIRGDPFNAAMRADLIRGLLATTIGFFIAGAAIWGLWRFVPGLPISRRLVLNESVGRRPDQPPSASESRNRDLAPGETGTAVTPLRPAGTVDVSGRILDARTQGEYIDAGSPVRVVSHDRFGVVVEMST